MGITIRGRGYPCTLYATDTGFVLYWEDTAILTFDNTASPKVVFVDGVSDIMGTLEVAEGLVATPSMTFSGDLNTGFYNPAANTIGVATNGATAMYIDASKVRPVLPVLGSDGTKSAVAIGFASDVDTGLYTPAVGSIAIATAGGTAVHVNATDIVADINFCIGASGTPATSGAAGIGGRLMWDASYLYIKTAADGASGWKRVAVAGW